MLRAGGAPARFPSPNPRKPLIDSSARVGRSPRSRNVRLRDGSTDPHRPEPSVRESRGPAPVLVIQSSALMSCRHEWIHVKASPLQRPAQQSR